MSNPPALIFQEPVFEPTVFEDEYDEYEEEYEEEFPEPIFQAPTRESSAQTFPVFPLRELRKSPGGSSKSPGKQRRDRLARLRKAIFRVFPATDGYTLISPNYCTGEKDKRRVGKTPGEKRSRNMHEIMRKLFRVGPKRYNNGLVLYSPNYCRGEGNG